ncbi:MAG TPA: ethanolamine permease, partial [Agriterribacter sp.]|nr:ethanolamine permease [Agriterribacter sp.]
HSSFKTPANALLVNMVVGIIALLTGKTGEIITMACFGALTLYIFSTITVLVLRKKEPNMDRPFKVPFYPYFPVIALIIALISLIAITTLNAAVAVVYFSILLISYIWFHYFVKKSMHVAQVNNN